MDQLDRNLIRILQKDAKTPFTRIAEELKQPDTNIHFRAKKLKENNTITRYCALVRPEALGYAASAIFRIEIGGHILPEISKDRTHTFAEELAENEQFVTQGLITLNLSEVNGTLKRDLLVWKMKQTPHSLKKHSFKIGKSGVEMAKKNKPRTKNA